MTQQSKEELFRLYLDGKITILKKYQREKLEKLFAAEFGTPECFAAQREYDEISRRLTTFNQVKDHFEHIFKEEL